MSSIYQPHQGQGQTLAQQLKKSLGLAKVQLGMASGSTFTGVIGELGDDYLLLIEPFEEERLLSLSQIEWVKAIKD